MTMYRIIKGLMAKHSITIAGLSKIIGKSATTMSNKMNRHVDFMLSEAKKIQ